MKKIFAITLFVFATTFVFAQNNQTKSPVKNTDFYLSLDLNAPLGDFKESQYRLAPGADQYNQKGTFNPGLGATVGVEIPLSFDFSVRPAISFCGFSGTHYVGDFDSPKMKLYDFRFGGDLLYYLSQGQTDQFYVLGSLGLNLEKLQVDRKSLIENYNSKRFSAGVGFGYAFGESKSFAIEGSILKSIGGTPPCTNSFPDLCIAKISLLVKL